MDREEYIYYQFMKKVTEDEYISLDESGLILILEDRLGLSDDRMDEIMEWVEKRKKPPLSEEGMEELKNDTSNHLYELKVYERILEESLKDEKIEKDEKNLLFMLTEIMNVSEEERGTIYNRIKGS
ncbi:MAG: hypothetical protein U9R75_11165 [Candidatus Thermoplasmatota archaeon]|nr:hypothetical protein [Candidatus Thermoplasmatota archaeon]